MIVVDVNVIAYLLIAGEKTADARAVRASEPEWVVPDLWRDEFLNILTTYVRQGGTSLEAAKELWQSAVVLFEGMEKTAGSSETLDLADRYDMSAYDAQYLAVAVDLDAMLITENKALVRAAPERCMTMPEYIESTARSSSS